jgi:glycerol uptake facilitator-like aquaporin
LPAPAEPSIRTQSGASDARAPKGFAPIAIGLGLTLIHLIGIPVTNLSVNPARSTGAAVAGVAHSVFAAQPEPSAREAMPASA